MNPAAIILAAIQAAQLILEMVEKYHQGQLSDEELYARWHAMQARLKDISAQIQAPPTPKAREGVD